MSRRADRLFRLVAELRGRRLAVTARELAHALEVSKRTIYRDIQDLAASGVPIEGEAGVGYLLDPAYDLPPVMFTLTEVQALLAGNRMVQAFTDPGLAAAATSAEVKLRAILNDTAKVFVDKQPYRVPVLARDDALRLTHGQLRAAIEANRKLHLCYQDADETLSDRTVWPYGLIGWHGRWTLLAWCELRDDYRNFRVDRISRTRQLDAPIPDIPDRGLAAFLKKLDLPDSG